MATTILAGDVRVLGNLSAGGITLPNGSVFDAHIGASANISVAKLRHQHKPCHRENLGVSASAETIFLYTVTGQTALVNDLLVGLSAACTGTASVTVDLQKANGTSILSTPLVLNSANAAYVPASAVLISTPSLVAGAVLKVVVTVAAPTGAVGTGLFFQAVIEEDAQ